MIPQARIRVSRFRGIRMDAVCLLGIRYSSGGTVRASRGANHDHPLPVAEVTHQGYKFSFVQNISTLDPARLLESDFMSLSNRTLLAVRYQHTAVIFSKYDSNREKYIIDDSNFPDDARGFLYLHSIPGVHSAASNIRFRICADRESFAQGHDLLLSKGTPWRRNLINIISGRECVNVPETLEREGLVSGEVIGKLKSLVDARREGTGFVGGRAVYKKVPQRLQLQRTTFSFKQPFSFIVDNKTTTLHIVDLENQITMNAMISTRLTHGKFSQIARKNKTGIMCLEYDPHENRMLLNVLQIPRILHGKTLYSEGDVFPAVLAEYSKQEHSIIDILRRQSTPHSLCLPSVEAIQAKAKERISELQGKRKSRVAS